MSLAKTSPSYRKTHYADYGSPHARNAVTYIIYPDKQIVFTGSNDSRTMPRCSTINFAERIVMAIAQREKIDPKEYTFFDLQTRVCYTTHQPGDYSFSKLLLTWEGDVIKKVEWKDGHCATFVLEAFAGYIKNPDMNAKFRNLAEAYGAIEPLPKDYHSYTIDDLLGVLWSMHEVKDRPHIIQVWEEFEQKLGTLGRAICADLNIPEEQFEQIPKPTKLGPVSYNLFEDLIEWVVQQDKDLDAQYVPILFFEA